MLKRALPSGAGPVALLALGHAAVTAHGVLTAKRPTDSCAILLALIDIWVGGKI